MVTLREFETECIRYTAEDKDIGFSAENYVAFKSKDIYKDYVNNVLGSINRAIQRVVAKDKIPHKQVVIDGRLQSYNLEDIEKISGYNIKEIYSVSVITSRGYVEPIQFSVVNKTLFIRDKRYSTFNIIIDFVPFIRKLTKEDEENQTIEEWETTDTSIDLESLGLTYELLYNIIIYYVKGELFGFDNPSLALRYTQVAEQYLEEYSIIDSIFVKQDMVRADANIREF